jgi:hypothetical protein
MMISKELEGATVERVYWAVLSRDWLPVVGEPFDSLRAAGEYADKQVADMVIKAATVVSRVVFRKPDGTTVDMEIGREKRFR